MGRGESNWFTDGEKKPETKKLIKIIFRGMKK